MRKSDRLFQLTNILRRHQPVTARQLAEKLQVSERTIYRYIDDLSLSGIPVYGEAGVGYRLSEGFELPPLQLSATELEALITGVSFTASLTGAHFSGAAHSLLAKIEASLPQQSKHMIAEDPVVRVPMLPAGPHAYQRWGDVHSAIKNKRWLHIDYHSLADEKTRRTVFPLGLFYWGSRWTLGSWCDLRQDYRDFRLDRIVSSQTLEQPAVLPDGVSLSAYVELRTRLAAEQFGQAPCCRAD